MSKVILTNDEYDREENFISFEKINHKKPVSKTGKSQESKVRNSRATKMANRYSE